MEIKKPDVNQNMKTLVNKIYFYMKNYPGYHTKDELCQVLLWDADTHDRQIREVISVLAKIKPIISTSDSRGYKLAQTKADFEECQHQINELQKRADEILSRTAPLVNFIQQ